MCCFILTTSGGESRSSFYSSNGFISHNWFILLEPGGDGFWKRFLLRTLVLITRFVVTVQWFCLKPFFSALFWQYCKFFLFLNLIYLSGTCGAGAEWPGVERDYSGVEESWQQKWGNNLGLSSCAVPRSAVACVVAYFRRTELLPGVSERSGIDW